MSAADAEMALALAAQSSPNLLGASDETVDEEEEEEYYEEEEEYYDDYADYDEEEDGSTQSSAFCSNFHVCAGADADA